ncbi:DNA polymerase III subunit epsilon, partial [bacterium LRH843]|nr:DNA polymerase III subunit epsilon [bacterium LRH843]
SSTGQPTEAWRPKPRPTPLPSRITQEEAAAHASFIEEMGDGAVWKTFV